MATSTSRVEEKFIVEILNGQESELIDFKQERHSTKVDLVHDILCLANSPSDEPRYIVYGIEDQSKKIIGVDDSNRPRLHNIIDQLKSSNLNHIPKLSLEEFTLEEKTVSLLTIHPDERRPFFLLAPLLDKKGGNDRSLQQGAVYVRVGDTNTAVNSTASDLQTEQLWKIRFGLNVRPVDRFASLLRQPEKWESVVLDVYFHSDFPEFTIKVDDSFREEFTEEWCENAFPNPECKRQIAHCMYYGTILRQIYIVWLDGCRYPVPQPKIHLNLDKRRWFYWKKDSFELNNVRAMHHAFDNFIHQVIEFTGVDLLSADPMKDSELYPCSILARHRFEKWHSQYVKFNS